jgi:hypothetical protein
MTDRMKMMAWPLEVPPALREILSITLGTCVHEDGSFADAPVRIELRLYRDRNTITAFNSRNVELLCGGSIYIGDSLSIEITHWDE